jgi:predicted nucleic acid-binding protein
MIILDTNVISALMLREPDKKVIDWLDGQAPESIWTTSISVFEIRFGLEILDEGNKKKLLKNAFNLAMSEEFSGRILDFDNRAASEAAILAADRRKSGRSVEFRDTMICGIARARHASVATRNVKHFQDTEVRVINPWEG